MSERFASSLPKGRRPAEDGAPEPGTPASVLYTSGTTGRPKGCILSHGYELAVGARYASLGGLASLRPGRGPHLQPLPLYHANAGVFSLFGAILTGSCQIQPDRFHPGRWWREIAETRATVVHYLGVIAAAAAQPARAREESSHSVRFGIGAGVEPQLHRGVRAALRLPAGRGLGHDGDGALLADCTSRARSARALSGAQSPGVEVRVVDDEERDVPEGQRGRDAVPPFGGDAARAAASRAISRTRRRPRRRGAAAGSIPATSCVRDADGMLHFVDRKKNIIRRSGENIAAAEVEAVLLTHPDVQQAAVMAVQDELREEEVLACVVLRQPSAAKEMADGAVPALHERLAYYKAPGWMHFVDSLPTTGTQKIQKHAIYPPGSDPCAHPDVVDMRALKRRQRA